MKAGRVIDTIVVIADCRGLAMSTATPYNLSAYTARGRVPEEYYPEHAGAARVTNPPSIFSSIWGLIQNTFDEGTREKVN